MDSFVAVLAVACWLLLMIPAAFVLFVGPTLDGDDRAATPALALVPAADGDDQSDRPAA